MKIIKLFIWCFAKCLTFSTYLNFHRTNQRICVLNNSSTFFEYKNTNVVYVNKFFISTINFTNTYANVEKHSKFIRFRTKKQFQMTFIFNKSMFENISSWNLQFHQKKMTITNFVIENIVQSKLRWHMMMSWKICVST